MTYIDTTNNSAFLYSSTIIEQTQNLCYPLTKFLGITCFCHMKVFPNGSYLILLNGHTNFLRKYIENIIDLGDDFMHSARNDPIGTMAYYKWANTFCNPIFPLLHSSNIWNGLTVYNKTIDCINLFCFGFTPQDNDKTTFFVQNISTLNTFINYFTVAGKELLDCTDKSKLALFKNSNKLKLIWKDELLDPESLKRKRFLKYLEKQYKILSLSDSNPLNRLSRQQYQCVKLLANGYTMKNIGQIIGISNRTVESYLKNVKDKFNFNYKSQITDMFHNNKPRDTYDYHHNYL